MTISQFEVQKRVALAEKFQDSSFWMSAKAEIERKLMEDATSFVNRCRVFVGTTREILPSGVTYDPSTGKPPHMSEETFQIDVDYMKALNALAREHGLDLAVWYSSVFFNPLVVTTSYEMLWTKLKIKLLTAHASMEKNADKDPSPGAKLTYKKEAFREVIDWIADWEAQRALTVPPKKDATSV